MQADSNEQPKSLNFIYVCPRDFGKNPCPIGDYFTLANCEKLLRKEIYNLLFNPNAKFSGINSKYKNLWKKCYEELISTKEIERGIIIHPSLPKINIILFASKPKTNTNEVILAVGTLSQVINHKDYRDWCNINSPERVPDGVRYFADSFYKENGEVDDKQIGDGCHNSTNEAGDKEGLVALICNDAIYFGNVVNEINTLTPETQELYDILCNTSRRNHRLANPDLIQPFLDNLWNELNPNNKILVVGYPQQVENKSDKGEMELMKRQFKSICPNIFDIESKTKLKIKSTTKCGTTHAAKQTHGSAKQTQTKHVNKCN